MATIDSIPPQAWIGISEPTEAAFDAVGNPDDPLAKPAGGLWTSPYDPEQETCPWLEWMKHQRWGFQDGLSLWVLDIDPSSICYKIAGNGDLRALQLLAQREWLSLPGFVGPVLDFEAIATSEYNGLYLTEQGQQKTRSSLSLYQWDCECTFWCNWVFTDIRCVRDINPTTEYN